MSIGRVNAATFISRYLGEPHDSDFGGEAAHRLFNAAQAPSAGREPGPGRRLCWRP
jgi:hypothetical protein